MTTFNKVHNKHKLNTQARPEVVKVRVLDLMFRDGFGPDEVRDHLASYCREIFLGGATPTAVTKVENALSRIEAETMMKKPRSPA